MTRRLDWWSRHPANPANADGVPVPDVPVHHTHTRNGRHYLHVRCPYCDKTHIHGVTEPLPVIRRSHCRDEVDQTTGRKTRINTPGNYRITDQENH